MIDRQATGLFKVMSKRHLAVWQAVNQIRGQMLETQRMSAQNSIDGLLARMCSVHPSQAVIIEGLHTD